MSLRYIKCHVCLLSSLIQSLKPSQHLTYKYWWCDQCSSLFIIILLLLFLLVLGFHNIEEKNSKQKK